MEMQETAGVSAPTEIVTRFLDLLAAGDVDAACDLLADDVRYINVSLPVVRGQDRVRRFTSSHVIEMVEQAYDLVVGATGP